ncbi:hypothetical protein CMV_002068 [Castanea mollissima]|uniref:Uncharacterized protein n=1 Tax=Castanea mollissima TaxID=60419 RepID=A0A8J4S213_9ROSI|nr:hypothetical protein CMV_002068 [Castanea mollissima]
MEDEVGMVVAGMEDEVVVVVGLVVKVVVVNVAGCYEFLWGALNKLIEFVDEDDKMSEEQRSVVLKRLMNIEDKDGGDEESIALAT